MRPAWLPVNETIVPTQSPRHVRPRSAASQSSSPAAPISSNSPPRDAMVLSARQLLHDPPPPTARESTTEECFVSLREFMDSFPLVPLTIIPRLRLTDLLQCQSGLVALYQSLAINTNADDAQLAKYITRQLGLVQRHMEQARAKERVLKLLMGEEPSVLHTAPTTSLSSTTLPVFLQPASPVFGKSRPFPAVLTATKSASPLAVKTSQLSKAKAVAKATLTTAFVITTRENSLKARHRKAKKKTSQQIEDEKCQQHEREKDTRRQAAYQRLLARQALQAKKKQDAQTKKTKLDSPLRQEASSQGSFVSVTRPTSAAPDEAEAPAATSSSSSSDESEVSNCSENDEADEKAILDMPVEITDGGDGEDEIETATDEQDASREEEKSEGDEDEDEDDEDDEQVERHGEDHGNQQDEPELDEQEENAEHTTVATKEIPVCEPVQSMSAAFESVKDEEAIESEAIQAEERVHADIARQLQQFVAERTQSALNQLRHQKNETVISTARSQPSEPSNSLRPTSQETRRISSRAEPPSNPILLDALPRPSSALTGPALPPSPTKQKTGVGKRPRPTASATSLLTIPRPIGRDVQDYRSYFSYFSCILTSVYEQRLAITSGSTSTSTTSLPSVSATAAHAGDQALRLQLKLYQSWETIMHDYATVFGNAMPASTKSSPSTAHYRINPHTRKEVSDIVVTALAKLGDDWDEHPSGLGLKTTWNLLWTWSKPNVERKTLLAWQRVNHFQHAKAITRKDCLKKSIAKYHAMGGRLKQAYDIVPASFLLPHEYVAFVQAFHERAKRVPTGKNIWIMKPVALSRGRGISLVNDLVDVVYSEPVVIQEYIANPLLLDGFKFDLRLYVLVTSFNPLEAFFYEDGFVRMCTRAYEDSDLSNLFIHLTNSSIQKENQDAIASHPENPINVAQHDAEAGGTKMTLAYLWKRLEAMGADVASVKSEILAVILKALLCGEDHIPFQVNSFDLYGYDILLDTNFRPWLIEVNSSPSMARENELDYQIKDALMYDTLKLVNPLHFDRAKLAHVIARRFQDAEQDKKRSHANTRHPKETEAMATRQLNEDLTEILRGHVPRAYGELPDHVGSYTRIAPHTTLYNQLMKLKKSCLRLDHK